MAGRSFSMLSFGVFACLIAALTFGMVLLGSYLHLGVDTFLLLVVPAAAAAAYLAWYRTLPLEPARAPKAAPPSADNEETFDDPVEEADRLATASENAGSEDEPVGPVESFTEPGEESGAPSGTPP
ncbi:MAG TPA: hypothetical protein VJ021_05875 [Thermoplasmata archaeon]|nr:hypothetical protein [Thermoplasmata archaeon]